MKLPNAVIHFNAQGSNRMSVASGGVSTIQDMTVNGLTIGQGKNSGANNTALGRTALNLATSGFNNVAVGYDSSGSLTEGQGNTTLGYLAGNVITTGNNNLVLGNSAQPSSATVSNEVTIGNDSVGKTRLRGQVYATHSGDMDFRAIAPSGKYCSFQLDNADQMYSMQIRPDQSNAFVIRNETSGQNAMKIGSDGSVDMPNVYDGFNTSNSANIYMSADGKLHRSTTATYSAEEVDKKLAIKDKIIEKLEARLTKLEARNK